MIREYYTTEEAAKVLGKSVQTLYQWSCYGGSTKGLKPIKIPGRGLLWPKEAVDRAANEEPDAVVQDLESM